MDNHTSLAMVVDCVDADKLADFWSAALGFRRGGYHPPYVRLVDPAKHWPVLLLQQVPEPKSGKNRMHLDIHVSEMEPELRRLGALGASVVVEPHDDGGFRTAILADPQGNEFCVIVPPAGYDPYYQRSASVDRVAGIVAPDSRASRAAFDVCARYADDWLRNHSVRAYYWAAARGISAGIGYDAELLYVAALLHDLALTAPFDSHTLAFEEAGADLARVFASGAGWSARRSDRLAEIIVLHMRDDVSADEDAESHLLQIAVSADVSGRRLDEFDPDFTAALLNRFPRAGFAPAFLHAARGQAERKPTSAAADLMRTGWAERITSNALDRESEGGSPF